MTPDKQKIEIIELDSMMSDKKFRDFIKRVLALTGVNQSGFDNDPLNHAFNAGKRKIGLQIISELQEACHDKYLQLLREEHDE